VGPTERSGSQSTHSIGQRKKMWGKNKKDGPEDLANMMLRLRWIIGLWINWIGPKGIIGLIPGESPSGIGKSGNREEYLERIIIDLIQRFRESGKKAKGAENFNGFSGLIEGDMDRFCLWV
jgi:hypothetical protein